MRKSILVSAVAFATALTAACNDSPLGIDQAALQQPEASLSIQTGDTYSHITLTDPSAPTFGMAVGGSKQMSALLHYTSGATLASAPYAQWMSSNNCVASVTSANPSWGMVRGVKAGTARIIVSSWGKADTVTVTVTGTGDLDPGCEARQWSWDYSDVSFTGTPATSYGTSAGEVLRQVVLFASPRPTYTIRRGATHTVRSELWYSRGGKLNGAGFVNFSTTDGSVATITNRGVVTGRGAGRVKVIARLGQFSDTVPLYVR
jgi:hypothetical protein